MNDDKPIFGALGGFEMRIFAWFARSRAWVIAENGTPLWNGPCWDITTAMQLVGYTTNVNHMTWDELMGEGAWNLVWVGQEVWAVDMYLWNDWLYAKRLCWNFIREDIASQQMEVNKQRRFAAIAVAQSPAVRLEVMRANLSEFAKRVLTEMCVGAVSNANTKLAELELRWHAMEKDAKEWEAVVGPSSWKERG